MALVPPLEKVRDVISETSPFAPGSPVPVELFVGRRGEVEHVRSLVRAAQDGRARVGFVSGERGIGKSSLASFVRWFAEHHDEVVGCHVYLKGVQDLKGMLHRVFDRLLKDSIERPWHRQIRDSLGERVRRAGQFGATLELRLDRDDLQVIERNFADSIREFLTKTGKKSLLLILDDINGLASSEQFTNWLKSTVDEIATSRHQTRLCVLLVGMDERRRQMIGEQPSLARVFELINIAPWSVEEVEEFYQQSFRSAGAEVSPRDLDLLMDFTGGLPVLAHEIGDAVWRVARTPAITRADIAQGIVLAAATVGGKYLEPQMLAATRSARYRSTLYSIVRHLGVQFTRPEIIQHIGHDDRPVLDNFLRRMRELGVLETVPGTRGEYRFPNRLSWLYFRMSAVRPDLG